MSRVVTVELLAKVLEAMRNAETGIRGLMPTSQQRIDAALATLPQESEPSAASPLPAVVRVAGDAVPQSSTPAASAVTERCAAFVCATGLSGIACYCERYNYDCANCHRPYSVCQASRQQGQETHEFAPSRDEPSHCRADVGLETCGRLRHDKVHAQKAVDKEDCGGVEGHAAVSGESRSTLESAREGSAAIAPSVTQSPHREDAAGIKPGPQSHAQKAQGGSDARAHQRERAGVGHDDRAGYEAAGAAVAGEVPQAEAEVGPQSHSRTDGAAMPRCNLCGWESTEPTAWSAGHADDCPRRFPHYCAVHGVGHYALTCPQCFKERSENPPPQPADEERESDGAMLQRLGVDGEKWAAEFQATAMRLGYGVLDEGWLLGWFCNAIMAGHDHARWKQPAPAPTTELLELPPRSASVAIIRADESDTASVWGTVHSKPNSCDGWLNTREMVDVVLTSDYDSLRTAAEALQRENARLQLEEAKFRELWDIASDDRSVQLTRARQAESEAASLREEVERKERTQLEDAVTIRGLRERLAEAERQRDEARAVRKGDAAVISWWADRCEEVQRDRDAWKSRAESAERRLAAFPSHDQLRSAVTQCVDAMRIWAAQEDGIPDFAQEAFTWASTVLGHCIQVRYASPVEPKGGE